MKKILLTLLLPVTLLLMTTSVATAATDQPLPLPVSFYGTVLQGTSPAPAGSTIEARGEGVVSGPGNPIIITQPGIYGSADPLANEPRFFVQGNIPDGTEITFYINGILANETADFIPGAGMELNLTTPAVTQSMGAGGSGGGGGAPVISGGGTAAILSGLLSDTPIILDDSGQVLDDVALTDTSKIFTLKITKSTAITIGGVASATLTANPVDISILPAVPETAIVLAQDFGPDGTNFYPEVTLTMTYDPAMLPAGINPENLTIAYWDTATTKWVKLAGTVDTATHSITVLIQHFTIYAIIGDIAEAPSTVTISTTTAEPVAPPTPDSKPVSPAVPATSELAAPNTPASVPITPAAPLPASASLTWIWFVVAGIGLIFIISVYFMKRRSRE